MQSIGTMRKSIVLFLTLSILSAGCIRLKGNVAYEYVPDLPKGTVPAKITIESFEDVRPDSEKKHTKDIEPVGQKITRKIYDDFRKSELFETVLAGDAGGADLLIKGRIQQFYWKNRYQWYTFVPGLNLILLLFGAPAGTFMGEARISLDIVSQKTGKSVGTYESQSYKEDTYTGYRSFWGITTGTEAGEALREVVEDLKTRILADKSRILQAATN